MVPAHFGRHFCVMIVDFLSVSVRVSSLEVALGLVLQRISRDPARECGTSALLKSTAAQIETFSKTESDRPVFFLIFCVCAWLLLRNNVVLPACVVARATPVSNKGRLVIASRPVIGSISRTNKDHQLYTSAVIRAVTCVRLRSWVVNPPQPHWFFSSSNAFSACGKACKDDPLGGKSASSLTHLVWLQKLLFVVQRWKGKRG